MNVQQEIAALRNQLKTASGLESIRLRAEITASLSLQNLDEAKTTLAETEAEFEQFQQEHSQADKASLDLARAYILRAQGWCLEVDYKLPEATERFREALDKINAGELRLRTLLDIARNLRNYRIASQAFPYLEEAQTLMAKFGSQVLQIQLMGEFALAHQHEGQTDEAKHYLQQVRELYEAGLEDTTDKSMVLQLLGGVSHNLGNFADAERYYETLIPLIRGERSQAELLAAMNLFSSALISQNKHERALKVVEESVTVARRVNMPFMEAMALKSMSDLYMQFGELDRAISAAEAALELQKTLKAGVEILGTTAQLGKLHIITGAVERGMKLMEAAAQTLRGLPFNVRLISPINALVDHTPANIELDTLKEKLRGGADINFMPGRPFAVRVQLLLGKLSEKSGDLSAALEYYEQALKLSRNYESTCLQAETLTSLGMFEISQNKLDAARRHLRSARLVVDDCPDWTKKREVHEALAKLFEETGEWRQALEQHKDLFELERSILLQQTPRRVQRLMNESNVAALERKRDKLKSSVDALTAEIETVRKGNEKLEQSNQQNEDTLREIQKIMRAGRNAGLDTVEILQNAAGLLQETMPAEAQEPTDVQQEPAEDQEFLVYLKEQFNALTPKELKVCDLLRLNLGTKTLARMMNVSPRAIESYRYRIRRKMAIESGIDLAGHVQSLYVQFSDQ